MDRFSIQADQFSIHADQFPIHTGQFSIHTSRKTIRRANLATHWRENHGGRLRSGLLTAVVNLDQADAGAVVQSREQRGVKTRRQRGRNTRLKVVSRRKTRSSELRGLSRVILPVVIRNNERSIAVAQLERWIDQRARHTKGSQARSDTARDNSVSTVVTA
jgi:hypothetical protein